MPPTSIPKSDQPKSLFQIRLLSTDKNMTIQCYIAVLHLHDGIQQPTGRCVLHITNEHDEDEDADVRTTYVIKL